jgi:hypothetical protein
MSQIRKRTGRLQTLHQSQKIKKGQFKLGKLGGRTATMPEIWQAALAA